MTRRDRSPDRLLMGSDQLELIDRSVEQQVLDRTADDTDDARRAEYRERLREALPELRKIEGFPIGTDEDILALSDPPYYTACPNPFLAEFIAEHGTPYDEVTDDYRREPFAADVSEGKNDPIYNAHSYHTKVPHKAIMRYILHYTKPGDIVFDGFCGTGMTGVAAQLCGSPDPDFKAKVEAEWAAAGHPPPQWGPRYAILNDLSPAATFIAYNYNTPVDVKAFEREARRILDEVEMEVGGAIDPAEIYRVWSNVVGCPSCGSRQVWWDMAVDLEQSALKASPACSVCGYEFSKRDADRLTVTTRDLLTGADRSMPSLVPVLAVTDAPRGRVERTNVEPAALDAVGTFPLVELPAGDKSGDAYVAGVRYLHDFFGPTSIGVLSRLLAKVAVARNRRRLLFWLTSGLDRLTWRNGYRPQHRNNRSRELGGPMPGNLYFPPFRVELSPVPYLRRRVAAVGRGWSSMRLLGRRTLVSTGHGGHISAVDESIDYIFTDPPFGANLQYSELNFVTEAVLGVATDRRPEAVVNASQHKEARQYQALMEACFVENFRILRPGRWMTVEFHNSSNAIWNAIQEAIQRSGFVVADVRVLDKGLGTLNQFSSAGAVKQDLVISAYKPRTQLEDQFAREAGTEPGAWDFIREHLGQLPVFVEHDGRVEVVAERQNYLLYDRMVAFHIQRGATVPLSAGRFYEGLRHRFLERDDMYFTELQAAAYDRKRLDAREVEQLSVFVVDERSAIHWLRAQLLDQPQTFQQLHPQLLQELNQSRFETLPELRDILAENFLEDPRTHRWRVPDPGKQADMDALRSRGLLNEFRNYLTGTAKLKSFRLEAIRAGFAELWANRDYKAIIKLAERLPDEVVQEDPALLMYYDNALTREGAG